MSIAKEAYKPVDIGGVVIPVDLILYMRRGDNNKVIVHHLVAGAEVQTPGTIALDTAMKRWNDVLV